MKILRFFSALFVSLILAGCGSGGASNDISMYDLHKSMIAADDSIPDMFYSSPEDGDPEKSFSYVSDVDYEKVDDFFIAYSSDGKLADEVVVIRLKDSSDVAEMEKSLKDHAKDRENLYSTYIPEQQKRAGEAVVFSMGDYAVLIISDNSKDVKAAFEEAVQ